MTTQIAGFNNIAGQLLATNTNDDATSGNAGQLLGPISRVRSNKLSLTNNTTANVGTTTKITLTAGDWDMRGGIAFQASNTTTVTELDAAISQTSATLPSTDTIAVPTSGEVWYTFGAPYTANGNEVTISIPPFRVTVANAATLDLYLVARALFGTSTCFAYGAMEARRIR